jgi:formylglycine-generating enzyme
MESDQDSVYSKRGRYPWYYVNPIDGMEMVLVPGGWFHMGAVEKDTRAFEWEKPGHLHYVEPFYMAVFCVTVDQFGDFVKDTGHDAGNDWAKDPVGYPARFVNWEDAKAYCRWAGLRLPTEAEWEHCARGYGGLIYPWGDNWENGRRVCWDKQKGPGGTTAPVPDHPEGVSRFGTFQQSGNLLEWCEDGYDQDVYRRYAGGDFIPPSTSTWRVLRGGSWATLSRRSPSYLRAGFRDRNYPDDRFSYRGFRAARTPVFND